MEIMKFYKELISDKDKEIVEMNFKEGMVKYFDELYLYLTFINKISSKFSIKLYPSLVHSIEDDEDVFTLKALRFHVEDKDNKKLVSLFKKSYSTLDNEIASCNCEFSYVSKKDIILLKLKDINHKLPIKKESKLLIKEEE